MVTEERHKIYFHKGDVVKFKDMETSLEMKVDQLLWGTNDDGSLKKANGRKVLEGVLVGFFDDRRNWITKKVDSRSIYKVEYTGQYHLIEAKKYFFKQGLTDIVELINKALDKCL